jgi:hypothetical protein
LRGLLRYDGDFVNALYVTPHAWTPLGHALRDAPIVEPDLWRWDYRHQVVGVRHLSPGQLLLGVKLVELIYHLSPRRLWRILAAPGRDVRRQLRHCAAHIAAVYGFEVWEPIRDRLRAIAPWRRRASPVPPLTPRRGPVREQLGEPGLTSKRVEVGVVREVPRR